MSLLNHFLAEQTKATDTELRNRRAADQRLSTGPNARFTGKIEIDGTVHYYDARTHIVERRVGSHSVRECFKRTVGRRRYYTQTPRDGWVVGASFNGNGYNGMYARHDAYVLRPKSKDELADDVSARDQRKAKIQAKRALPWAVRMVLSWSKQNRKGVLRCLLWGDGKETPDVTALKERLLPGFIYAPTRVTCGGETVPCGSPYGPRTINILVRLGLTVSEAWDAIHLCKPNLW